MSYGLDDAIDLGTVRRALVIKLRHHGDVLLSSPVFSVLKNHAPRVEIDALVYDDTREMLADHPAIANVHTIGRKWRDLSAFAQVAEERRLLAALRARRYDLLVSLTEHNRGAWLARLLGVRYAVGPSFSERSRFWRESFTHRFATPKNPRRHMVEWNLDALRRIGIQPSVEERRLVMEPGAAARGAVDRRLAEHGLADRAFVHLHPASRWLFKTWPAASFAALIDRLHEAGHRVVVTAAPSEPELAMVRAIRERTSAPTVDLAGQLSLRELAALTARATLFVGVDSAPMHIAAAMGTPTVAIFGPSGDAEWAPWMVPHRVVASERHLCRPCGIDGCGGSKVSDCLVTLPVDAVWAAARALLDS
jgi:heptosyltransferase-3